MRRLGALLLCLVAPAAFWMLLVDTSSIAEYSAGAAAALLGVLACALVSHEDVASLPDRQVFLRGLPRQLARVPADLWRVNDYVAWFLAALAASGGALALT